MEAIDLNDDGQNDLMDEDIEDHEVIEISEANRGTPPRHAQSRRRARLWLKFTIIGGQRPDGDEKTEEEKEEEEKEKEKEEESGESTDLTRDSGEKA
ncbi:hypothetical protein IGI04_005203 [Brassica rapa subsp. trilocularis]|uniref:Uncharacterized protein n=1 Tax=Brassica rapa subsp. trilocularis TaxID=1813537 RepID=A0ABQ7NGL2_BRACM|nr:hypothetical protein IGI04_005203 [Brassica rapa subsp. trilocularis]